MSIGTNKGAWWADINFGSELWILKQTGKVNGGTADTLKRMVLESVQWIIDDGLAQKITCAAERQGKNTIAYTVSVYRENTADIIINEVWNAV